MASAGRHAGPMSPDQRFGAVLATCICVPAGVAALFYTMGLGYAVGFWGLRASIFLPPVLALIVWRAIWARALGYLFFVGVSWTSGIFVAIFVFHDAP